MNVDCESSKADAAGNLEGAMLPAAVVRVFVFVCILSLVNQVIMFLLTGWLMALLVVVGAWAAVASVVPVLSWPNALIALGLAIGAGGLVEAVNAVFGFPFTKREFVPGHGPLIMGLLPWWLPLAWGTFDMSARGVARLILFRTREHSLNGLRVIGLATVLAGAASVGLEIFATRSALVWESSAMSVAGYAGLFLLHLAIQVVITPMLIDKFPGRRLPNWLPLWVWGGVMMLLVAGIIASAIAR